MIQKLHVSKIASTFAPPENREVFLVAIGKIDSKTVFKKIIGGLAPYHCIRSWLCDSNFLVCPMIQCLSIPISKTLQIYCKFWENSIVPQVYKIQQVQIDKLLKKIASKYIFTYFLLCWITRLWSLFSGGFPGPVDVPSIASKPRKVVVAMKRRPDDGCNCIVLV